MAAQSNQVRWSVKDYQSTTISLYESDYAHIVEHHPVMRKNEAAIAETASSPETVYRDGEFDRRRVYYKQAKTATNREKIQYTAVVVEGADATWTDARIVTAFP